LFKLVLTSGNGPRIYAMHAHTEIVLSSGTVVFVDVKLLAFSISDARVTVFMLTDSFICRHIFVIFVVTIVGRTME